MPRWPLTQTRTAQSSGEDQAMKEIANNIVTSVTDSGEVNIKPPQPMESSLQLQSTSPPMDFM